VPGREPLLLQTARDKHASDFTGRLYTDDQARIWQHVNGADPVRAITADGATGTEQLRMLLSLRDVAGEVRELDRTGSDPDAASEARDRLARLHTAYTTAYGPVSKPGQTRRAQPTDAARAAARDAGVDPDSEGRLPTGWGWFRKDPHAALVLGLEHWDRANDRAVLSEVLTRRPGARRGDLEPTDDPKTALTAVMGATGGVDLPLIASLLGTTPDEARRRLGTEVFDNPVTKKLEHAGAYLSGPVRQKLDQAREAAATDPTYAVNVAALEAAQPPPKRLGQFTAQLGAHWIPAPLVQGFLREYLGDPTLQISHNERYGWSLASGKVPDAINALKGTERRSAVHIAKALLGRASMVVNQLDGVGVDEDATRAMRYKADAMRSAFEEYCTASTARVTLLTDAYNRQMNGHVVRNYDGLAPTLAGFTTERTPHPWQLSGAARMQFERGVVLAHEVGLGKTTTMVMGSQALKASGQIAKPFAVVQPHLARQWLDEAKLLYRNADIRLITSDDLKGENRRPVLEWLRSNTPDLVIFTEGAFQSIRMSPEQQELYLFREIESLKEQLERERGVPHNAFALMKLEQRLATVESRIRRNDAPMRTPGEVYWDDLGFDYALIDEAHRFTAVGFRSKEAGGETASVRAVDLHQKLSWHHRMAEYDGGRPTVTLGTGTPMENSIFEQYSVLELATPWLLDQFGVHGPDLWSETFGQKVQRIEMAPDGSGLTIVERFSRFVSKSTMKTMWGLAADTKTGDEVGIERPSLAGGAPELVLVEPTGDQRSRLQSLVARGQAIHAGDVTRDEDNMLAVTGEGRAVALDPRLVDANAPAANKLVTAADIIAAGYHAHKDHTYAVSSRDDTPHPVPGGLFFVFCNSGTPGGQNKGGFDAYAELRDLLAARGVPRDLVQFAQDNATPEKKAAMSEAANNGGIAVLMGSTEVLGTGFNGQNRAYALMHLDQDWTPASMIQRNGRVIRPGNQHEEVNIYFLATKGSMDAWQVGLLTSKAEGLRDIQRPPGVGDDDNDSVEEIGASDWDYATMAAEIGGNPFMRQFMEAKVHLQGLEADRRNLAADRVRQAELLLAKKTELSSTQLAIAARDAALPKVTATIRGDAFHIRMAGRDFDQRGEAGPVLRQAVASALRSHSTLGLGPWTTIGTFGGLDFAVQPEIRDGGAEIRAHVGFPDLRHSESVCSIGDLANPKFGATIIGRLATALEKAEDHQLMDRERLPVLDAEITLLAAQQAAVDYGPAIEHARRRVELLDAVVGAITERDKLPELTESMLDPEKYRTPDSRQKAVQERAEQRAPHQAKVDQAAAALAAYDQTTPAPELPTAPAAAPEATPPGAIDGFGDRAAIGHNSGPPASLEPADDRTEDPTAQATEPDGDGYGTTDLFDEFGLTPPERVPAREEGPTPEPGDPEGIPEGQMTLEDVQPEAFAQETPAPAEASVTAEPEQISPTPPAEPAAAPDGPAVADSDETGPAAPQGESPGDPIAVPRADWWDTAGPEELPQGYQPFTDASVELHEGDTVRIGSRRYAEDRHLLFGDITVAEGPEQDGYYIGRSETGARSRRFHPRDIVAVPAGSRLAAAAGSEEHTAVPSTDMTEGLAAPAATPPTEEQPGPADAGQPAAPAPEAPAAASAQDEPSPAPTTYGVPKTFSWGLIDGESITYRGQGDGRYQLTLPGASYLVFYPSIEYRRTHYSVALNDAPLGVTPKRLRRFEDPEQLVPWVRAHASKRQTGYEFRDGAWIEVPPTVVTDGTNEGPGLAAPTLPGEMTPPLVSAPATEEMQLDLFGAANAELDRAESEEETAPGQPAPQATPPGPEESTVTAQTAQEAPAPQVEAGPKESPRESTGEPAGDAEPVGDPGVDQAHDVDLNRALVAPEIPVVETVEEAEPHGAPTPGLHDPLDDSVLEAVLESAARDADSGKPESEPDPGQQDHPEPVSDPPQRTADPQNAPPAAQDPMEVPTMATPADQVNGLGSRQPGDHLPNRPWWTEANAPEHMRPFLPQPAPPAAAAAPHGEAGHDLPEPPDSVDWPEFEEALAAWDELGLVVPAAEVRAAVAADVAVLSQRAESPAAAEPAPVAGAPGGPDPEPAAAPASTATPPAPAAAPAPPATPVVAPAVPDAEAAVGTALAGADAHAESLQGHPEWQRIQSVRGALGHAWDVMKEKAGAYWDTLRADVRFQGFWRTAAIRACEAISVHAAALANRLRPGTGDLPAADALLRLSDATITYSTVAAAEAASTPAPPVAENAAAAEPAMQRLVERRTPTAYATRDDAVRAAEEITARFQKWINTPMGQEAVGSSHMRVMAFRDAWRQLPPHDSGPGPAVGPYGAVAERAQALVAIAVRSARFAPADVQALQGLAQAAENHSARLSVTLPPGTARPAQRAAAPAPRVATPTAPAARTPRASA
jgi:N12 class adenine-specific DNA methylase